MAKRVGSARGRLRRPTRAHHKCPDDETGDQSGDREAGGASRHDRRAGRRLCDIARDGVVDFQSRPSRRIEPVPAISLETSPQEPANRGRRVGRQRGEVRLPFEHCGERVRNGLAGKCGPTGEHLIEDTAKRPDVGPSIERLAPRLFGAHARRHYEDWPPMQVAGRQPWGCGKAGVGHAVPTFASPKSSTLAVPSLPILTFDGLTSRWMIPLSCAASSASAICRARATLPAPSSVLWQFDQRVSGHRRARGPTRGRRSPLRTRRARRCSND